MYILSSTPTARAATSRFLPRAARPSGTAAEAQPVDLQSDKMQDTAHTRAYLESTRF
ncbi:twin-arginine translocation pathway signal protein [uncultured Sulfitobacter sp.]|uniref:twin-arginine translocation pathway signal protein n=1 Tax=uncultured Sulfitobacter sp. TaxID=191468 RepID=UPI00259482CC|nr:twin-arginine translocation pathway signal protein [uncultured Sulfitobacter sp.]